MNINSQHIISILAFSSSLQVVNTIIGYTKELVPCFVKQEDKLAFNKLKDFYETYNVTPKDIHLSSCLEGIYDQESIDFIERNYQLINEQFVVDNLMIYIRHNEHKVYATKLISLIQEGTQSVNEVDTLITNGIDTVKNNSKGTIIVTPEFVKNSLETFKDTLDNSLLTGITALDLLDFVPVKGDLRVMAGASGSGKSMYLTKQAVCNLRKGFKVLLFTLEISAETVLKRMCHLLYSVANKENTRVKRQSIVNNTLVDTEDVYTRDVYSLTLDELQESTPLFNNFRIIDKEPYSLSPYMLGSLIADQINSGFIPDIVQIDSVALLNVASLGLNKNQRTDEYLLHLFTLVKGLAKKYNVAVETVHQVTVKMSELKGVLMREHLADAKSIAYPLDNLFTWTCTPTEKQMGIGRIYIDKCRNNNLEGTIVVNEFSFPVCDFSVNSHLGSSGVLGLLKSRSS